MMVAYVPKFQITTPRQVAGADRQAIDAFLATQGARRFAQADSGDDFHLCGFLTSLGYEVYRNCSRGSKRAPFFIDKKGVTRVKFLALVNAERAKLGLPPVGPRT